MSQLLFSASGDAAVSTSAVLPSRSFRVNPERETLLHSPGAFRLTIPPNAFNDKFGMKIRERVEMKVNAIGDLVGLFAQGLHTWAEGQWMGLHQAVYIKGATGDNLFLPPLTLDLRRPQHRKSGSSCQLFRWEDASPAGHWKLRIPPPLPSTRFLGQSYFRVLVTDPAWIGFLHPVARGASPCMITLRMDQELDPKRIRIFVRLHELPCFGPVFFHGDRWGATGLPSGYAATFFALGNVDGVWYFGQESIEALRNQKLRLSMQKSSESEVIKWVQQLLG